MQELKLVYTKLSTKLGIAFKKVDDSIAYMIFTISSDIVLEEDNDGWEGFVEAIKRHINKKDEVVRDKIKSLSEKVVKIDKDVGEIKSTQIATFELL